MKALEIKQCTIIKKITTTGIGLHSGKEVTLSLLPAPANHGVVFQRTDLDTKPLIPANGMLIQDTMMSSNLVKNDIKVGTVEHLLSAVAGLGIDNLIIEVSASEIPIMDGSAFDFVELINKAGIHEQEVNKQFLQILKSVRVEDDDKWAELTPFDGYELNFQIDFDHPAISATGQVASLFMTPDNYTQQLSKARTFGFLKDIEQLRKHNLALGGSLENAIVVDESGIMNPEGLRTNDEFVRHKILDAVGDLFLIGYPILGKFNGYKSGHGLNNQLIRKVLNDPNCYKLTSSTK